jgi:hypothetical protein
MSDLATHVTQPTKRRAWVLLIVLALLFGFIFTQMRIYSLQPIGALPEGATVLAWHGEGSSFFDSADGLCLKRMGEVSLLCRMAAFQQAPQEGEVILRLPYQHWAYLLSTGGKEFEQ